MNEAYERARDERMEYYVMAKQLGLDVRWETSSVAFLQEAINRSWDCDPHSSRPWYRHGTSATDRVTGASLQR